MRSICLILLMLVSLSACASKKIKTEVKNEIANEPPASSNFELYKTEQEILVETQTLSPDQKEKLNKLLKRTRVQTQSVDNEIMQTKAVLFKSLLSQDSNKSKINLLENQLLKLNRKKTRQTLGAYREARAIVGKSELTLDRTLNMIDHKTIHEF